MSPGLTEMISELKRRIDANAERRQRLEAALEIVREDFNACRAAEGEIENLSRLIRMRFAAEEMPARQPFLEWPEFR